MAREIQVKYSCDCGDYHVYKPGETYDPTGWLVAMFPPDDGRFQVNIMRVEDMTEDEQERVGNKFFVGVDCFTRWLEHTLFPPEIPPPPPTVPAVAEKPITDDDVPF